jgi:hypothetical protein
MNTSFDYWVLKASINYQYPIAIFKRNGPLLVTRARKGNSWIFHNECRIISSKRYDISRKLFEYSILKFYFKACYRSFTNYLFVLVGIYYRGRTKTAAKSLGKTGYNPCSTGSSR